MIFFFYPHAHFTLKFMANWSEFWSVLEEKSCVFFSIVPTVPQRRMLGMVKTRHNTLYIVHILQVHGDRQQVVDCVS